MSLPFPITTPRQLLEKAKREIDALASEANGEWGEPDGERVADLTINAAWSLWHVTDWIGNNEEVARVVLPAKGIKATVGDGTQAFQNQVRCESSALEICWLIALRFKHFELDEESKARRTFQKVFGQPSRPAAPSLSATDTIPEFSRVPEPVDYSAGGSHGGIATIAPSDSTLHPKVTFREQRLRLTDVYGNAYTYLDALLKKHAL